MNWMCRRNWIFRKENSFLIDAGGNYGAWKKMVVLQKKASVTEVFPLCQHTKIQVLLSLFDGLKYNEVAAASMTRKGTKNLWLNLEKT